MTCLTLKECIVLCRSQQLYQAKKSLLYSSSSNVLGGQTPLLSREQSHFSRFITELNPNYHGCLVWITAWGISPAEENPAIVIKLREAFAECRRLIDAPGHLFNQTEADLSTGLIRLVLAFAWDAHIIHTDEGIAVTLSHDGWFEISTNSPEIYKRVSSYITEPDA